ncbi:EamA family transporter [Homoserinimonas sp. A520]
MRHFVFVLLAAICFGTTGTAQEFGPDGASALSVGAARIAIGGGALALVAWLARAMFASARRGGLSASAASGSIPIAPEGAIVTPALSPTTEIRAGSGVLATDARGGAKIPVVRDSRAAAPTWLLIAFGAAGVVAYQPAFFLGTSLNGVAVGTIVALGSAPILTGALEWAVTRVFPGIVWLVATLVATVGVVLLTGIGGADAISVEGLAASLAAGASYAVYALASKRLLVRGWTPTAAMGSVFGWAAAASVPLLLVTDLRWLATGSGIGMALWLGLVTTTLAYLLFARGLIGLSAATVSTLTLAEPLTATLLGILVLNEQLSGNAVIGIIVLALGLVLLVLPRRAPAISA